MKLALVALLAAMPLMAHAQQDCRDPQITFGSPCYFGGTSLPEQKYMGDLQFQGNQHAHLTEPLPGPVIPAAAKPAHPFFVTALGTEQTETLGFKRYVSDGYKLEIGRQFNGVLSGVLRGTDVRYDLGKIGQYAGNNHTVAAELGFRVQYPSSRASPYAEALIGGLHQYRYGMSESGVVGVSLHLAKHLSLIPAEATYRYATFQKSTAEVNPRRGRIEVSSGLQVRF